MELTERWLSMSSGATTSAHFSSHSCPFTLVREVPLLCCNKQGRTVVTELVCELAELESERRESNRGFESSRFRYPD